MLDAQMDAQLAVLAGVLKKEATLTVTSTHLQEYSHARLSPSQLESNRDALLWPLLLVREYIGIYLHMIDYDL